MNNGQCEVCLANHYCPGDDTIESCPPVTYNKSDIIQLLAENGYDAISVGTFTLNS